MSEMGTVTISARAVMQIAAHIAKRNDGVKRLTDRKGKTPLAIRKDRDTRGVYISRSKRGLELEICVICRYGVNTVRLCSDITKEIRAELGDAGFKNIRVHITGAE